MRDVTPDRWEQIGRFYAAASELPAEDRAAFLRDACRDDPTLREEVESLLASGTAAGAFLNAGAMVDAAAMLAEESNDSLVGRSLGHYKVLSLVGSGGMGEVYRARDSRLNRDVAVKVLPALTTQSESSRKRFHREAQAVAALSHPNIRALYDVGEADGRVYAVMELLEGETLRARLARGPLPSRKAMEIGAAIADGLAAAHATGIVHRDLKPENVFITAAGHVKMLDFGLAKMQEPIVAHASSESVPGVILGTAGYMSPEQASGKQVDARSDIFSLGCVLYEMVSGRRAFERRTIAETLTAILNDEPPELASESGDLRRIVAHCLEKQPDARLQSAQDLAFHLRGLLNSADTARAGLRSVMLRSTGRRKASVFASAGLLLCAFAAIGYFRFVRERAKPPAAPQSIAVLPFKRLSAQPGDEYLGVGVCDVLVTKLSSLHHLVVRPTSAVLKYEAAGTDTLAAGRELRTDAVLEGSLQRDGDRLRVTVRLLNVADGATIWAETLDERFGDLFKVQDAIAGDVVRALALTLGQDDRALLSRRYTRNTDAYQLYLKGRYFWDKLTEANTRKSIEYFERAIALDPEYALAYTGLADAYWTLHFLRQSTDAEDLPSRAKATALKALALDDTLAEAHTSLGEIKEVYDFDIGAAEGEYKRALALNPNYARGHQRYGFLLNQMGRLDEAKAEFNRALALDPLSPSINTDVARPFIRSGDYRRAIDQLHAAVEIDPTYPRAHNLLAMCYTRIGRYDEAASEAQRAAELSGPSQDRPGAASRLNYQLAYIYARAGRAADARRVLESLEASPSARNDQLMFQALAHSALGDRDRAFLVIEKMYETQNIDFPGLRFLPEWDGLRDDARFQTLLRRSGLVP